MAAGAAVPGLFFAFAAMVLLIFASVSSPTWERISFLNVPTGGIYESGWTDVSPSHRFPFASSAHQAPIMAPDLTGTPAMRSKKHSYRHRPPRPVVLDRVFALLTLARPLQKSKLSRWSADLVPCSLQHHACLPAKPNQQHTVPISGTRPRPMYTAQENGVLAFAAAQGRTFDSYGFSAMPPTFVPLPLAAHAQGSSSLNVSQSVHPQVLGLL